jgi:hypothetical protein
LQNKNNQYLAEGINLNMSKMQNNASNKPQTNGSNNIQDNDYYKSLKDVKKEIDKIYNQLSKQETFPEILDNIKKEFLNNNINIIEDYLSKPNLTNYKGFNPKIIKILDILINILENFTYFGDGKDLKAFNQEISKEIKIKIDSIDNKKSEQTYDAAGKNLGSKDIFSAIENNQIIKIIDETYTANKDKFKNNLKDKNKDKNKDINIDKIIKCILTLYYYRAIFESPDNYGTYLDEKIKDANGKIEGLSGRTLGSTDEKNLKIYKEELKKAHDDNKKIYRDLFSY